VSVSLYLSPYFLVISSSKIYCGTELLMSNKVTVSPEAQSPMYVSVSTIAYCSQNKKCVSLHLKYKDERYV
jgi:hypothetical protein